MKPAGSIHYVILSQEIIQKDKNKLDSEKVATAHENSYVGLKHNIFLMARELACIIYTQMHIL